MSKEQTTFTFSIETSQLDQLHKITQSKMGVSVGKILRLLIKDYLEGEKK